MMGTMSAEFDRRLMDEIGCAEGCSCLDGAIRLAEDMRDHVKKLSAALRRFRDMLDAAERSTRFWALMRPQANSNGGPMGPMHLKCLKCDGTGENDGVDCHDCNGSGEARCDRRGCKELGVVFDEDGRLLCGDHAFEQFAGIED